MWSWVSVVFLYILNCCIHPSSRVHQRIDYLYMLFRCCPGFSCFCTKASLYPSEQGVAVSDDPSSLISANKPVLFKFLYHARLGYQRAYFEESPHQSVHYTCTSARSVFNGSLFQQSVCRTAATERQRLSTSFSREPTSSEAADKIL